MSVIDLDRAEAAFDASVDGTVGIEEEFAILDPESLDMVGRFEELRDSAADQEGRRQRDQHSGLALACDMRVARM